jgi:predicted ArsR family transcriptional regulator
MGKTRIVKLTPNQRQELEKGYRESKNATFSRRCHIVLLKSERRRSSKSVAEIVGTNQISVNKWLNRYESEGIEGLKTRPGRGRKAILNQDKDKEAVRKAVENERQRLKNAKELLEEELDKEFSLKTLQRFLKSVSAAGSASD